MSSSNIDPNAADPHLPHVTNAEAAAGRQAAIVRLQTGQPARVDALTPALRRLGISPDLTYHQIKLALRNLDDYYRQYCYLNVSRDVPVLEDELDFVTGMNCKLCAWCGGRADGSKDRILNDLAYMVGATWPACKICQYIRGQNGPSYHIEQCLRIAAMWPDEELPRLGTIHPLDPKFVGDSPIVLNNLTEENCSKRDTLKLV